MPAYSRWDLTRRLKGQFRDSTARRILYKDWATPVSWSECTFSQFLAKDVWYLPEVASACSGVVMYLEGTGWRKGTLTRNPSHPTTQHTYVAIWEHYCYGLRYGTSVHPKTGLLKWRQGKRQKYEVSCSFLPVISPWMQTRFRRTCCFRHGLNFRKTNTYPLISV
jgi:hypothetical protein